MMLQQQGAPGTLTREAPFVFLKMEAGSVSDSSLPALLFNKLEKTESEVSWSGDETFDEVSWI